MPQNQRMSQQSMSTDPYTGCLAINYGGGNQVIDPHARGVLITTGGALAVVFSDGSAGVLAGLLVGTIYAFNLKQITQTGSTAAGFILL